MRKQVAAALALLALGAPAAGALDARNTMADWLRASDTERSALLDALGAAAPDAAGRTAVLACMHRAAKAEGHGAIRIDEMARACAAPMERDVVPGETAI